MCCWFLVLPSRLLRLRGLFSPQSGGVFSYLLWPWCFFTSLSCFVNKDKLLHSVPLSRLLFSIPGTSVLLFSSPHPPIPPTGGNSLFFFFFLMLVVCVLLMFSVCGLVMLLLSWPELLSVFTHACAKILLSPQVRLVSRLRVLENKYYQSTLACTGYLSQFSKNCINYLADVTRK